jgi:predicted ABC-type sugar transport system permease subunit
MTDTPLTTASAAGTGANFTRLFERVALILVWLLLIAGFGAAMPTSFLNWGNFAILFASYAPAALLALAIIVPLTAGDYDLSVGATLTLSSCVIGVLNVWQGLPIGDALPLILGKLLKGRQQDAAAAAKLLPTAAEELTSRELAAIGFAVDCFGFDHRDLEFATVQCQQRGRLFKIEIDLLWDSA